MLRARPCTKCNGPNYRISDDVCKHCDHYRVDDDGEEPVELVFPVVVVPSSRAVPAPIRRPYVEPTGTIYAVTDDRGTRLTAGPLGILLVAGTRPQSVIVGTVTVDALAQAAGELAALRR